MMARHNISLRSDDRGGTLVEFALAFPVFLTMIFGAMGLGMLGFNYVGLRNAVEDAARCAGVKTSICADAASTQTYAKGRFTGLGLTPTFTATLNTTCTNGSASFANANQVGATASFNLNLIFYNFTIPLTATACYP